MAEISRFFNSVNGDRRYLAEEWAGFFAKFLSSGVYNGDHTIEGDTRLEVSKHDDLAIKIGIGSALIRGYEYENTTDRIHPIDAGGAFDRIDRVVIRMDRTMDVRNNLSRVIKGIPQENPAPPELIRTNEIYDISLAQIYVRKNATAIDVEDIVDERYNEEICGFVNSLITLPTKKFEEEWNNWMQEITSDTFAHARDPVTGEIYRMEIDGELNLVYFEKVEV